MWADIFVDQVIAHIFIPGNINGETYFKLLQAAIEPVITNAIVDNNTFHLPFIEDQVIIKHVSFM